MAVDVTCNPIVVTSDFTTIPYLSQKTVSGVRFVGNSGDQAILLDGGTTTYYQQVATADNFVDEQMIEHTFRNTATVLVTGGTFYIYLEE